MTKETIKQLIKHHIADGSWTIEHLRQYLYEAAVEAEMDEPRDFIASALMVGFGPGYAIALDMDLIDELALILEDSSEEEVDAALVEVGETEIDRPSLSRGFNDPQMD